MIREEVACPFRARLAGEEVDCLQLRVAQERLRSECRMQVPEQQDRGLRHSRTGMARARPRGHEWIEAYFAWRDLVG